MPLPLLSEGRMAQQLTSALVPDNLASKPGSVSDLLRELLRVTHSFACQFPPACRTAGSIRAPQEGRVFVKI